MPLIPQQAVVHATGLGPSAVEQLNKQLAAYPDCRIVTMTSVTLAGIVHLFAVIETV